MNYIESWLLDVALIAVAVVIIHNICGLVAGYFIGRLFNCPVRQCRTLSLEVGLQSSWQNCISRKALKL